MTAVWNYDHKNGWSQEKDFLDRALSDSEIDGDCEKALTSLGYNIKSSFYELPESAMGYPLVIYLNDNHRDHAQLPKYLIEFCPIGQDVEYISARNFPSLIELLNKLVPLATSATISDYIKDRYAEMFNKKIS